MGELTNTAWVRRTCPNAVKLAAMPRQVAFDPLLDLFELGPPVHASTDTRLVGDQDYWKS
jgi:hypothetical protein